MARTPGMGGAGPTGFEDYPDWEGYADAWPGTAATDPTGIPPAISSDWTTHFRPGDIPGAYDQYQDWAQAQGQDPLPIDRFNDLQYQQGVGAIPDAPPGDPAALASQGYGLQFDPQSTANTGWNLNYDILNPQGQRTGFDLSSTGPYEHFPWVPGGAAYAGGGGGGGGGGVTDLGIPGAGPKDSPGDFVDDEIDSPVEGGVRTVDTGIPDPQFGDVRDAPAITDYPFAVPEQQLIGMTQVGDDPISELMNATLTSLATAGGVAPTGYTGQTQQALSSILEAGGQGAEIPGQLGWEAQNQLSHLMGQQGQSAALETPLGQNVQQQLEELLANAGQLPADAQRRAMEMETLRDPIEAFRQAQLSQGQAELARRGLMGQGPEGAFMEGLEERLAPMYAQAGRDIALSDAARQEKRYADALVTAQAMSQQQAQRREDLYQQVLDRAVAQGDTAALRREDRLANTLQLASGMTQEQSRNLLATAQTWTERQRMLSDVVQKALDQDFLWNKFLAEYGLERDQAIEMIQSGRLNAILPVLQQFLTQIGVAAEGFVPYYDEDAEGVRGQGRTAYTQAIQQQQGGGRN